MIERLDDRTAFALARLKASPDFQQVLDLLTKSRDARDRQNRVLDGPELHRSQGAALALTEILDLAANASEVARKIQSTR